MSKFLLQVNGVMATGLEILNPIIAASVFVTVLQMGTNEGFNVLLSLIAAAVAAIAISGPIAVLTNIRNMIREATRERGGLE